MKATTKAKKVGKRAAAVMDPSSISRMSAAKNELEPLLKMGARGEVKITQVIGYIVGTFPLLRREAIELLTSYGFQRGTVSACFQAIRSGAVDVPKIDRKK